MVSDAGKAIDVVVKAKDLYSNKTKEYSILRTMVTREGERIPRQPEQLKFFTYLRDINTLADRVRLILIIAIQLSLIGRVLFLYRFRNK